MKNTIWRLSLLGLILFPYGSQAQIFSEQSEALGINHNFLSRGLMGGGAIFFDADQDGDEDLYLNGGLRRDDLYLNDGNGVFTLAPMSNGLEVTLRYNTTASVSGDIDNDGDRDLFVCTWEDGNQDVFRNLLFENLGDGSFQEIGAMAGITDAAFSIGANFVDYNRDGFLDIYVSNHIETSGFLYDDRGAIVGFDHDCFPNFMYRNNGDGTFSEVASELGINDSGCALATLPSDYDLDGDADIFIANDFGPFIVPNRLLQNDYPNNGFTDISEASGAEVSIYGMGVASGDYDNDLDLDYYITNLGANVLLENQNNSFVDVAASAQVENTYALGGTNFSTGWGTAFFDIDNDTWLDLFVANGRIPSLPTLPTSQQDPNKLFHNNSDRTFTDISAENSVGDTGYSRGMAYCDIDADGDLDFIVTNLDELGGTTKLYRNDSDNDHHYVQFKLVGVNSNRDAYGAKLWLYAGEHSFLREIDGGGGSFCSQSSSIVHYGLGDIEAIDSVRIEWPSGHIDHLGSFAVDSRHQIEEGIVNTTKNPPVVLNLFSVVPNPVIEDQFSLVCSRIIEETFELELFSASGQLLQTLKQLSPAKRQSIKLPADLPTGLYHIRLRGATWQQVLKLVVR